MKAKVFILAALSICIAACNQNTPTSGEEEPQNGIKDTLTKEKLLGKWSEPYHVNSTVKSLIFGENDTLVYIDKPDTTWPIVPAWAGEVHTLHYSLKNSQLYISGIGYACPFSGPIDTIPFEYKTDVLMDGEKMVIDSFSYDGGVNNIAFVKSLILYKQ